MSVQTIAVVGAMEQEIELLRESMNNVKHVSFGKFSAYEGELAGKRTVLVLSGIGKVNAAVSTSWVIHQFTPDCVINTGSAGGLGKGLKVGDVVIGETVAHHDVDVTAFGYVRGQVPQLPAVFASDANLIRQAEKAAQVFEGAAVTQGLIVSGDRFVHSSEGVAEIRSHFPEVKAVEMEAAAIAQTCHQLEVPFVIIRAVSDSADEKADISFEEFLKTAAVSSAKMVTEIVKSL
ncbi:MULTISPECIES: 5'-methylthioadenosine/adenosylhomocysteine nucleosidase [Neisseria]|uniref:5'-methylthioadenosine/S-adenosylhomocysteine nucleosidase n=1 Tax=Neisseria mucosa C102 TaxID=435832 RepID=A0ABP2KDJ8_NEIMU|nr:MULTISPECIES: 5'-methylthioadenosine/adenosylhomocysteine nucleosidase [Neisseria]EFV80935.1 5-methylthioadenosine nucleosidase/S-adenosylhomocysteine nucleosidase [Neisseria mucosa C102]OFM23777.1 5'-methylthioadenosine nucleosidase [Neisseria sp. HMSC070A01]QKI22224.1 5'-methylthioadenosine/adenosylhomocysteine nucleosidase [Neisseria mucosa]